MDFADKNSCAQGVDVDIELLKILLDGGFSAVIIFMLYDMRKEAREQREQTWTLLTYLIERQWDEDINDVLG